MMNGPVAPRPDDQSDCVTVARAFQEYAAPLSRYIYSKVGQVALAEDLTSEVFLKALRWLEHGRSAASVRGWLYTTARTVIADHWRQTGMPTTLPLDVAQEIAADDLRLEAAPLAQGTRRRVQRLLRHLPERERQVLLLRYVGGYTAAEIGQELGLTPSYVRVVQFRALRQAALVEQEERSHIMDAPDTASAERMRRVLAWAEEEARALNHQYIGTEHLLLGVLREEQSTATTILSDMRVSVDRIRGGELMIVGRGDQPPSGARTNGPRIGRRGGPHTGPACHGTRTSSGGPPARRGRPRLHYAGSAGHTPVRRPECVAACRRSYSGLGVFVLWQESGRGAAPHSGPWLGCALPT